MDITSTYKYYQFLRSDDFCFAYQGYFSDEVTDVLINLSDINLVSLGDVKKMRKKVSFLMAECYQNIVRHSDDFLLEQVSENVPQPFFASRNVNNTYYIISANPVHSSKVAALRRTLEELNTYDNAQLKKRYLEVLEKDGMSEKGGAGLGLIEMARKSGQKLEYNFISINEKLSYFYLQIKLRCKEQDEMESNYLDISESKSLHYALRDDEIMMIHKDYFSQEAIKPVLRMVESNLVSTGEQEFLTKTAYHLLVELLQNISKHSIKIDGKKEGVFLLSKKTDCYIISTGNFVSDEMVEDLKTRIEKLNSLNKDELKLLYKEVLKNGQETKNGGAGLGLIDIARESTEKIIYDFQHINKNVAFFSISIKLKI